MDNPMLLINTAFHREYFSDLDLNTERTYAPKAISGKKRASKSKALDHRTCGSSICYRSQATDVPEGGTLTRVQPSTFEGPRRSRKAQV